MRSLLLLFVFLSGSLLAQIPNPGFESWVPAPWYPSPEGWETPNDEGNTVVTQDQSAFEGDFAMRVDAVLEGIGAFGWAECTVPIDYIPSSLDFYVKAGMEFGGVIVTISFYNNEFLFNSFYWNSGTSIEEWTLVSIPLEQNEPVLTHAVIRVEAQVGDLVPGTAWISIDSMGFESTLRNEEKVVKDKFQLYPNPARDHLVLNGIVKNSTVSLVSITGKTVFETRAGASQLRIDLRSLSPGVYIVNMFSTEQVNISQKLVIQ